MAALAASELAGSRSAWRGLAWTVAIFAALINIGVEMYFMGRPGHLVLVRDIVSVALMSIAVTHLAAWLAAFLARKGVGPALRFTCSVLLTLLLTIPALVIGVLVHCTSGDCL